MTTLQIGSLTHIITDNLHLRSLLNEVANDNRSEHPVAVVLTLDNEDSVMIVIRDDEALLNFIPSSGDPPYFTSLGDPKAKGMFAFLVDKNHYSEVPRHTIVSASEALNAACDFLVRNDRLPQSITWVMD